MPGVKTSASASCSAAVQVTTSTSAADRGASGSGVVAGATGRGARPDGQANGSGDAAPGARSPAPVAPRRRSSTTSSWAARSARAMAFRCARSSMTAFPPKGNAFTLTATSTRPVGGSSGRIGDANKGSLRPAGDVPTLETDPRPSRALPWRTSAMPSALTIPGVQIRTLFEPAPVLPGATGILGVVGVTDRGPLAPTPIGSFDEFLGAFGPGSRYTLPEVRQAFTHGVSQVVVARTAPGGPATKATATLLDDDGEPVALVAARAEGAWGNQVAVRVRPVRTLSGRGVKYVDVEVLLAGETRETWPSLVMDPSSPNDLFTVINERSALITAVDPAFEAQPPKPIALTTLQPAAADRPSETTLKRGADAIVRVVAKEAGP